MTRINKKTTKGLLIDTIPNSPKYMYSNIVSFVWQTVRRITTEIWGVKGLTIGQCQHREAKFIQLLGDT